MSTSTMINIPEHFHHVCYNAARIPGGTHSGDLNEGANCQLFIYEILRTFGRPLPPLRSRELWQDTQFTDTVDTFCPLDIFFYHRTPDPFGAHLALFVGDNLVFHLSQENRHPKLEQHSAMMANGRYRCFIGAKRVKQPAPNWAI